jgi:hypothetical protein
MIVTYSSGLGFASPRCWENVEERCGSIRGRTSLIVAARISGHGSVYGWEIVVATGGDKTVVAQCR